VSQPRYKERAAQLRAEIQLQPTTVDLVESLEKQLSSLE
jgi:hypothetical protein